jgi:hypothetical protein
LKLRIPLQFSIFLADFLDREPGFGGIRKTAVDARRIDGMVQTQLGQEFLDLGTTNQSEYNVNIVAVVNANESSDLYDEFFSNMKCMHLICVF